MRRVFRHLVQRAPCEPLGRGLVAPCIERRMGVDRMLRTHDGVTAAIMALGNIRAMTIPGRSTTALGAIRSWDQRA